MAAREEMKLINQAYEILSDSDKRAIYDLGMSHNLADNKPEPKRINKPEPSTSPEPDEPRGFNKFTKDTDGNKETTEDEDEEVVTEIREKALWASSAIPSNSYVDEGVKKIMVFQSCEAQAKHKEVEQLQSRMEARIREDFDCLWGNNKNIEIHDMRKLGLKHQVTSGKWIIPVSWERADKQ